MKAEIMKIENLKKELGPESIDFKPTNVNKSKTGVSCQLLAYKDARVDMDVLDEAVGAENWQNKYERDSSGVLQCGIGIYINDQWIWKWSNGTPSEYEKVKGEYSDAFKRAGFMWGIGRMLYEFPVVTIWLNEGEFYEKDGKTKLSQYDFKPNDWKWTLGKGYKEVKAEQKIGNNWVARFNTTKKTAKPVGKKAENRTNIQIRYDTLMLENKELMNSAEIIEWARSSEWDVETLTQKGKDLKYLTDSRKQELYDEKQ